MSLLKDMLFQVPGKTWEDSRHIPNSKNLFHDPQKTWGDS